MKKENKQIPKFKTEDEEREFWLKNDALEYFDLTKEVKLDLRNLKPSTQIVTMRMPEWLVEDIKMLANKRDVPYQSLIKVYLSERVKQESYPTKQQKA